MYANNSSEESPVGSNFAKISEKILRSAQLRIDRFELELLQILHDELDLIACSFYSRSPHAETLSLRGQIGLSYDSYKSFTLDINSTAGLAFLSPTAQIVSDLRQRPDYRDKKLIDLFHLNEMIVFPIYFRKAGEERKPVCSICIYPKIGAHLAKTTELLNALQPIIELSLEFSLDRTSHLLRTELVRRALYVSDASSFLYRMLQIVKQEWNFEAGSVFLYDTRAKCLRLAATTGLNVVGLQKRYIYYRLTETDHQTVRSFVNQEQLTINEALIGETPPKYREKVRGIYHSALATPFFAPEIPRRHDERAITRCLGVLRLVNRQIIHGHHVEIAEFTWEDIEVVNFLVDVIGVVTHLYQRVAQKAADFERVVHGLETSILTVIGALHNINDNVDTKALFPLFLAHTIPDTISFAESIHEQIRVFKMRDIQQLEAAKFTNVKLVADVVMKIPDFAKNSAKFFGVDDVTVDRNSFFQSASDARQSGERIQPVPSVYADPNLLLFVLKNLIENAIKYSRAGSRCFIKLSWTADAEFVSIYVSDSGIGVPPEDEAFIFYETYQAENAMRRRTQGTGIGLYQCRLIMEKLGGSISYRRDRDHPDGLVTTFVVRIPRKGLRR